MDYIGIERKRKAMLPFCGQEKCLIDANSRIKLSPRFIDDFMNRCGGEVVLHCLPEGALAIYPEDVYLRMRGGVGSEVEKAGISLMHRRMLRSFGALSQPEKISPQGRITLPVAWRTATELNPGMEIYLIGVEIGVEIWNAARWDAELTQINAHLLEKGEREMAADLTV